MGSKSKKKQTKMLSLYPNVSEKGGVGKRAKIKNLPQNQIIMEKYGISN